MPFPLLAAIPWHDIHPMLVNFTAALVPASIGSDVLGKFTRRQSLGHAAWWMLFYAAAITPFTTLAGWLWKRTVEEGLPPEIIHTHQWLGISLAFLFVVLASWRGLLHRRDESPGPLYFLLAIVVFMALAYQGSLGGKMVFG